VNEGTSPAEIGEESQRANYVLAPRKELSDEFRDVVRHIKREKKESLKHVSRRKAIEFVRGSTPTRWPEQKEV